LTGRTSFEQLRARLELEKRGFTVTRMFSGIVRATIGSRKIYGPDMVSVLETAQANYQTPKKGQS
jgi:hypothetical protein